MRARKTLARQQILKNRNWIHFKKGLAHRAATNTTHCVKRSS